MNLLRNERFLFIVVILILIGVIGVTGFKIYENNEPVLQKRDKEYVEVDKGEDAEIVWNCAENIVSCSLLYDSKEEIPEVAP